MSKRRRGRNDKRLQSRQSIKIVSGVLVVLTAVLLVNGYNLKQTQKVYDDKIAALELQINNEKTRSEEIESFREYTATKDFIEATAKSKLGLVYENEIIFRREK